MSEQNSVAPILVDARIAAQMCGMSRAAWYAKYSAGKIPRPVKIGSVSRWRRDELEAWITADCPPLAKWDLLRRGK